MPKPLRKKLIFYLFEDVFWKFRFFLHMNKFKDSYFYYYLAFEFLPRHYKKGEVIIDQGEEV